MGKGGEVLPEVVFNPSFVKDGSVWRQGRSLRRLLDWGPPRMRLVILGRVRGPGD